MQIKHFITNKLIPIFSAIALVACNSGSGGNNSGVIINDLTTGVSPAACSGSESVTFTTTTTPAQGGLNITFQFFNPDGTPVQNLNNSNPNCNTNNQGSCSVTYSCDNFIVSDFSNEFAQSTVIQTYNSPLQQISIETGFFHIESAPISIAR